jgi:hypothetical protein
MLRVRTVEHLAQLAGINEEVYRVLHDLSISRARVVEEFELFDCIVSEKVVRTYRSKYVPRLNEDNVISMTKNALNYVRETYGVTVPVVETNPFLPPVVKPGKPQSSGKKVIAFGDFQINKHDPKFMAKTLDLIEDQKPDIICLTGDESDNSAVGRWAKGMREEFESNLQDQIDETVDWLADIREVAPSARIYMAHSNHMDWITRAVETRIPGFNSLRALTPEEMYKLDELDIQYQRQLFEFLPNYLLGHGHQWNLSSASHKTKGIEHVMRTGCSILAGHVHQATLQTVFIGYEGKGTQKVYANPGCMMDFEKAMESNGGYIGGTSPNWSKGIVVITREAGQNYTELVLGQNDGSFHYQGVTY